MPYGGSGSVASTPFTRTSVKQMVSFVDPNVFETANAGFAQAMYEEFLRDPAAVGPEWRRLFESGVVGERNGAEAGKRGRGGVGSPFERRDVRGGAPPPL